MLITNKHASTESFAINVDSNRIERTSTYKYLGVIVDQQLTWKEHCKWLCCTSSKYVSVIYKVKHYVNNQALRMLYHSCINSRVQYGIIAWGIAATFHLKPLSVVLNRAMRCLITDKLLTNKVTNIYKMQKILQLKDIYNLEVSKFMSNILPLSYRLCLTIILNSLLMFIHIIQDRSKLDNLLYQKHV